MSRPAFTPTSTANFQLKLPARLGIVCAIFFADKILLNQFIDFDRAQEAQGLGALLRDAQHWGFRFIVAMGATVALFACVRDSPQLDASIALFARSRVRLGWMMAHAALIACLAPLSYLLYSNNSTTLRFAAIVLLWMVLGVTAGFSALLALGPWALWRRTARSLGVIWLHAAIVAGIGASAIQMSQRLWSPMAAVTFDLVRRILLPIIPTLTADPRTQVLSSDRFSVEVSELCSGLEGMGLIVAFCVTWLLYFRREYIFPRALILLPVGLVAIFALNVLRIAALMLIGHLGYADVAEYGFHSQAGWIAFNTVACSLVFFSRRSAWLNRSAETLPGPTHNPTAVYLMPLLAILAAGAVSHAMSGTFETLYPLRLVAGGITLGMVWKKLSTLNWRWSWRAPLVGATVFGLWALGAHLLLAKTAMPSELSAMSSTARHFWLFCRILASVVTVPLAEELAYRGYLMRRLAGVDFESMSFHEVRWPAVLVTAVCFGLAHGAMWLPAMAAGLAYGILVIRRASLGEAVVAHATTNALVAVAVLWADQWQLL